MHVVHQPGHDDAGHGAVLAEGNTGGIYDNWFAPQWWGQGQTGLALQTYQQARRLAPRQVPVLSQLAAAAFATIVRWRSTPRTSSE